MAPLTRRPIQPTATGDDHAPLADEGAVWDAVLERYRATLDAHRAFLQSLLEERLPADVHDLPPMWTAPDGLPPMPRRVHEVAVSLQHDTDELIRNTSALLARSAPPPLVRPRAVAVNGAPSWDQRL